MERFVQEGTWMLKDLVRIRCYVVLHKSNCHHAGSPAFRVTERQFSGYPPASGSRTALTQIPLCRPFFVASSYLARFLARSVGRPRFRLRGSVGLTVGLAIGGAVSIVGEIAVGLSGWSLWNKLKSFLRCWTAKSGSQVFSSSGYLF